MGFFVVVKAGYSDSENIGYFTDPRKAYFYCDQKNKESQNLVRESYYVEDLKELELLEEVPKLYFIYDVIVEYVNNKFKCSVVSVSISEEEYTDSEPHRATQYGGIVYTVKVCLEDYDKEKAVNVAFVEVALRLAGENVKK